VISGEQQLRLWTCLISRQRAYPKGELFICICIVCFQVDICVKTQTFSLPLQGLDRANDLDDLFADLFLTRSVGGV
jgi:hypothetical protein